MSSGTLTIAPMMGNLQHDTDNFFKMSPYVKLKIGTQEFKTKKCSGGGKTPQWSGEQHTFTINNDSIMYIDMFDHDTFSSDDYIGQGTFSLVSITGQSKQATSNEYVPMTHKGKACGNVMCKFDWFPNAQNQPQQQQQQMPQQQQQMPQQQQQMPQQQQQMPQQQMYPQQQQQMPQQQMYPQQQGMMPQQQGMMPQQQGMMPQQQMYPQQQGMMPQQQMYPQQQGMMPQQQMYPQQQMGMMPQQQGMGMMPQQQMYPQQGGMGMGMGMGGQQPMYPQQQQQPNWFYQPQQPTGHDDFMIQSGYVDKEKIKKMSPMIFYQYDRDRSGTLDKRELYGAICALFAQLNHPAPSPQYVNGIMWEYDRDGNMNINVKEFKKIVKSICKVKKNKY